MYAQLHVPANSGGRFATVAYVRQSFEQIYHQFFLTSFIQKKSPDDVFAHVISRVRCFLIIFVNITHYNS